MLRKHKTYSKFRSCTDINNYNNFLIELDKKFTIETKNQKQKQKQNQKQETINKKNIIPVIDIPLLNSYFSGLTPTNRLLTIIDSNLDPNLYVEKDDILSNKIRLKNLSNSIHTSVKKKVDIDATINNIDDLIKLIDLYPDDNDTEYNINMNILHKIKLPLTNLNNMIGMKKLKEDIVDQILFYMQNLHTLSLNDKTNDNATNDFMHTVIYGPPGTGKTELAKIIGSIFSKMGILKKGTFKKVTRSDLIAGYLGQTALKTNEVIKECLGGVLFIDEAYSLGNEEKRDSFSKECIDTLCEAASDHKENLMIIIAGYEDELNNCFFSYNTGLNSRFTWRYKTDEYSGSDLYNIFLKKVKENQWNLEDNSNIDVKWFEKNKDKFKFYGRDIETLFAKVKIVHGRRIFGKGTDIKKKLSLKDLDKGLEVFIKNSTNNKTNEEERIKKLMATMYI